MIQRIQSIYYLVTAICLALISFGLSYYIYETHELRFTVSAYGIQKANLQGLFLEKVDAPAWLGSIVLMLQVLLTLMSFKNLKRQILLGRITLVFYLFFVLGLIAMAFLGGMLSGLKDTSVTPGIGFYIAMLGLIALWMGNRSVKKDKSLLDSLNRLR